MFEYEFDEFKDDATNYTGNKLPFTNAYTVNLGTTLHTASGFSRDWMCPIGGPITW